MYNKRQIYILCLLKERETSRCQRKQAAYKTNGVGQGDVGEL